MSSRPQIRKTDQFYAWSDSGVRCLIREFTRLMPTLDGEGPPLPEKIYALEDGRVLTRIGEHSFLLLSTRERFVREYLL